MSNTFCTVRERRHGRFGDGELSPASPGAEPADHFRYDPLDPVPFVMSVENVGGPDNYSQIEARPDVLVYTTGPMNAPMLMCGPVKAHLFASTSARDTDWTAKVVDVHPDGYAQRLSDGIVRARFRESAEREVLLTPGKIYAYDVEIWPTCVELQHGHRLRLEISSSAFPKFDRNLNTGGRLGFETNPAIAAQSVYHDREHQSYVLLPIVPLRQ
jgi:uncharacterized protein